MKVKQRHKGAIGELAVCGWLLEQGFDVFRNVNSFGMVDIIALDTDTGVTHLIDAKATFDAMVVTITDGKSYPGRTTKLSIAQRKFGVKQADYDHKSRSCSMRLK